MDRGASFEASTLFVCGPEYADVTDVKELMASRHIEDHQLAIDALKGWARVEEDVTAPRSGQGFMSVHHFYNKKARRGAPYNYYGNLHENKAMIRRDVHTRLEDRWGWLARPLLNEVIERLNCEERYV